jgi:hypothetical protein
LSLIEEVEGSGQVTATGGQEALVVNERTQVGLLTAESEDVSGLGQVAVCAVEFPQVGMNQPPLVQRLGYIYGRIG